MTSSEVRILGVYWEDSLLNVLLEDALLNLLDKGLTGETIRFWVNPRPTVVIGRFQDFKSEVDVELCRELGVHVVRRCTGGGAVYQDSGNLNWSVFVFKRRIWGVNGVKGVYRFFGENVCLALKQLGVKAVFKPPNSVYVSGKKISGMAMAVKRKALLCHGTLLVNTDPLDVYRVLRVFKPGYKTCKNRVPSARELVTSLRVVLGRYIPFKVVENLLLNAFCRALNLKPVNTYLSALEEKTLREVYLKVLKEKSLWVLE